MHLVRAAHNAQDRMKQIDEDIKAINIQFSHREEFQRFHFKGAWYTILELKEIADNLGAEKALLAPLLEFYEDKLEMIY